MPDPTWHRPARSAAVPLHETKIRYLALKLAGDWRCDDIYGTADEIAEYIATGRYPGKGVTNE